MLILKPILSLVLYNKLKCLILALNLFLLLILNISNFLKKLLLIFNSYIFYILSNIIIYICDYSKKKKHIILYINIIK